MGREAMTTTMSETARGKFRDRMRERLLTPPNLVSLIRVGSIPILVGIMYLEGPLWSWVAGVLFLVVSLTDLLDGWLARRLKSVSILGQFLDPVADKLLIASLLVVLVEMGRVPAWMAIIILCREIAITGLRAMGASWGIQVPSDLWGKFKTAIQMLAVLLLIVHHPVGGFDPHYWGLLLLGVAVLITAGSGLAYFQRFRRGLDG